MSLPGPLAAFRANEDPANLIRRGVRYALMGLGWVLVAAGALAFLAFLHTLGILLAAVGLILVLRHSFTARRTFIRAQRRHPKIMSPIRRLIRREPQVIPVLWQQSLRLEQLVLPKRWRFLRRTRRGLRRRR